jgi:hypothetical protein
MLRSTRADQADRQAHQPERWCSDSCFARWIVSHCYRRRSRRRSGRPGVSRGGHEGRAVAVTGVAGSPDDGGAARHRWREAMSAWELFGNSTRSLETRIVSARASGGTRTPTRLSTGT